MGSDGLGTQAEEGSQDPRLRRQDGLVRRQIRPWLSYGIMIMKFSFICIGTVFLVLLLSLLRWRSCFRYHSIPSFHHKGTPEVLTSHPHAFSQIYALLSRFHDLGGPLSAVHHLSRPVFMRSLHCCLSSSHA
jgi:hypothetical protein